MKVYGQLAMQLILILSTHLSLYPGSFFPKSGFISMKPKHARRPFFDGSRRRDAWQATPETARGRINFAPPHCRSVSLFPHPPLCLSDTLHYGITITFISSFIEYSPTGTPTCREMEDIRSRCGRLDCCRSQLVVLVRIDLYSVLDAISSSILSSRGHP